MWSEDAAGSGAKAPGSGELPAEAQALQYAFYDLDGKTRRAIAMDGLVMAVSVETLEHEEGCGRGRIVDEGDFVADRGRKAQRQTEGRGGTRESVARQRDAAGRALDYLNATRAWRETDHAAVAVQRRAGPVLVENDLAGTAGRLHDHRVGAGRGRPHCNVTATCPQFGRGW